MLKRYRKKLKKNRFVPLAWILVILMFSACSQTGSTKAITVSLAVPEDSVLYYTTDGSAPDENSIPYRDRIRLKDGNNWLTAEMAEKIVIPGYTVLYETPQIADASILRYSERGDDGTFGTVTTETYLPEQSLAAANGEALIFSIVTEPEGLFDEDSGIYVTGKNYEEWVSSEEARDLIERGKFWDFKANYTEKGKEWERAASLEIFSPEGERILRQDCGIRIHGGMSRAYPNKSLRILFREEYGDSRLRYPLLPDVTDRAGKTVDTYSVFVLRNGGNCAENVIFKDGWQQSLLTDRAFLTQACRPAILYLNGEYWGVYLLNDRYTDDYLYDRFGISDAIIVKEGELQEGREEDMVLYEELNAFSEKDLSDEAVWEEFTRIMDIRSMADFFAALVYIGSADCFPDKNYELWRTVTASPGDPYADGRWRFMLYDTEYASSCYGLDITDAGYDTFTRMKESHPLFAAALENGEFRTMFLEALGEIGSVNFAPERVNASLDEWTAVWMPMLTVHAERFGMNMETVREEIQAIRDFFAVRYEYIVPLVRQQLESDDQNA